MRKALEDKPSAELRRRAEQLIDMLASVTPSGQRLQALRAIEIHLDFVRQYWKRRRLHDRVLS